MYSFVHEIIQVKSFSKIKGIEEKNGNAFHSEVFQKWNYFVRIHKFTQNYGIIPSALTVFIVLKLHENQK